jgi:hypothetical protein
VRFKIHEPQSKIGVKLQGSGPKLKGHVQH